MLVYIRTDSSKHIATGHLMRCLTLAKRLREKDCDVIFICRNFEGNISRIVQENEFELILLEHNDSMAINRDHPDEYTRWLETSSIVDYKQTLAAIAQGRRKADWLIVDHYGLDSSWHTPIREVAENIMVIDDLANRPLDCNLVLDQNFHEDYETRYNWLVPNTAVQLVGPQYALLREEFYQFVKNQSRIRKEINNILIYYGGFDATNETMKALKAVELVNGRNITATVIAGKNNPQYQEICSFCIENPNIRHIEKADNMAELMVHADLALGAGGTTTWERCALGLPALITAVADNQLPISRMVDKAGFGIYLGQSSDVTVDSIADRIKELQGNPEILIKMSEAGPKLVDGLGTDRVVEKIFELSRVRQPLSNNESMS